MAESETVQKNLEIHVSAEGVAQVRRAMAVLSASFDGMRRGGVVATAQLAKGFNAMRVGAGLAFRAIGNIARSVSSLALTAGAMTFGAAIASAASLLGLINKVKEATMQAIAEEKRLSSSAAIFGIKATKTSTAAEIMGSLEYMFTKIGAAEADEVKDIITPLIENVQAAIGGDTTVLDNLGKLGLTLAEIQKKDGSMRNIVDILDAIIAKGEDMDPDVLLAALVPFFGDTDSQKMAMLINGGLKAANESKREFLELRDLTAEDEAISKRIQTALAREAVAISNLGTSLKRGFGGALAAVSAEKTDFLESMRGDLEKYALLLGRSYERIMSGLFSEANKLTEALKGPSGSLVDGPLEGWLMNVEGIILSVVSAARGLVEYLATGQTDNAFINRMIPIFEKAWEVIKKVYQEVGEFATFVTETVVPRANELMSKIDEIAKAWGFESGVDWGNVGIAAGILAFTGTLRTFLGLAGGVISALGTIAGIAARIAMSFAAAAASIPAITAVAAGVAGFGAGASIVKSAKSGQDYMQYLSELEQELIAQGKTEAEALAYIKVAIDAYKDEHGESAFLNLYNLIDKIPLLNRAVTTEQDIFRYIDEKLEEGMRAGQGSLIESSRRQALADFAGIDNKSEYVIDGIEMTREFDMQYQAFREKMTFPVALDFAGGLSQLANEEIRLGNIRGGHGTYFRTEDDRSSMSMSDLVRVENLYINGENTGLVFLSPDAYEKMVTNGNLARRAR